MIHSSFPEEEGKKKKRKEKDENLISKQLNDSKQTFIENLGKIYT